MIGVRNLEKEYHVGDHVVRALRGVTLDIAAGEFVTVVGPSGSGKSTFMHILGCLDRPTRGQYLLGGRDVSTLPHDELARVRNETIGFVFQSFNLVDDMSVHDNVQLALRYGPLPEKAQRQRVAEVLERLGLAHRAAHHPSQLSGGQQQRVAIARAIAARPPLLLADEPTGNLDSAHGHEVMRLLHELHAEGTTLVMVTHSAEHAALASRCIRLLDGRVLVDAHEDWR